MGTLSTVALYVLRSSESLGFGIGAQPTGGRLRPNG